MTRDAFWVARDLEHIVLNWDILLRRTSFEQDEGAILAIAGPDGAGKTTLLNLQCRTADPAIGKVLVQERSLTSMTGIERAHDRRGQPAGVARWGPDLAGLLDPWAGSDLRRSFPSGQDS